jgi:hypothetical protein
MANVVRPRAGRQGVGGDARMSLLDRVRDTAAGPRTVPPAAAAGGFDHVDVPSRGDVPRQRLTRRDFEALPLQERIGLLVQGTLRFYRGDREIAASEAMRAVY